MGPPEEEGENDQGRPEIDRFFSVLSDFSLLNTLTFFYQLSTESPFAKSFWIHFPKARYSGDASSKPSSHSPTSSAANIGSSLRTHAKKQQTSSSVLMECGHQSALTSHLPNPFTPASPSSTSPFPMRTVGALLLLNSLGRASRSSSPITRASSHSATAAGECECMSLSALLKGGWMSLRARFIHMARLTATSLKTSPSTSSLAMCHLPLCHLKHTAPSI
jgi:hypothetical protein